MRFATLAVVAATLVGLVGTPAVAAGSATPSAAVPATTRLRVMTFNIEYGGTVIDFDKIVAAVRRADPDVIGVNESYSHLRRLAKEAGYPYWNTRLDVISKFPLLDPPDGNARYLFAQLAPGQVVAVANVHLPSSNYGPRRILDGWHRKKVLRYERHRLTAMRPFVRRLMPVVAAGIPSFVMGDFNEPSSQDYTATTVGTAPQHLWPVAWPVSRLLLRRGFTDTFRAVFPDPVRNPGLTWPSGRPPSPDSWNPRRDAPHDRIDQVWMAGPATAVDSQVVGERGGPGVDIGVAPWGSDHRAVVSTVDVTPATPPVMVAVDPQLVTVGDSLTVTYHAPGAAGEHVVVVPAGGDPATDGLLSAPTPGGSPTDGTVTFDTSTLAQDSYDVVLADATDAELSRIAFWTRDPGARPALDTSKWAYAEGEPVMVSWTRAPGNRFDWIGIYLRHADPLVDYYKGYVYTLARVAGSRSYDGATAVGRWPLPPGRYTAYYLVNDNYREIASADFVVRA